MKFEDLDVWKRAARLSVNIYNSIIMDTASTYTDVHETTSAGTVTWDIHDSICSDGSFSTYDAGASGCLENHNSTDDDSKSSDGDWVIFEDITTGPYDFRLATNAYNEAQDMHTNASGAGISIPSDDILGTSRPQNTNYDCGAFEIEAAVATLEVSVSETPSITESATPAMSDLAINVHDCSDIDEKV